MVASYVRERERIFLRWLEHVERLLNQRVDRDLAVKAWTDGYSISEYAAEAAARADAMRGAEISISGRSYCDRKALAVEAAEHLKRRFPNCEVIVTDLTSGGATNKLDADPS
jgi:hypothetical protein